jgi:cytochrome b561
MSNQYNFNIRILHWILALLFITIFISGWFMVGLDDEIVSYKYDIYAVHKSFGIVALLLVLNRIIVRLNSSTPPYDNNISKITLIIAQLTHFILYLLMIAVPLSGFLMSMTGGRDISLFGYIIPKFLPTNKDFAGLCHDIHVKIPYIMAAFVVLHILAAIKHYVIDRDNIWRRINFSK